MKASTLISHGGSGYNELPYRDWVDQKPPAVFYVYRLALSLPFEPVRAIHFVG